MRLASTMNSRCPRRVGNVPVRLAGPLEEVYAFKLLRAEWVPVDDVEPPPIRAQPCSDVFKELVQHGSMERVV